MMLLAAGLALLLSGDGVSIKDLQGVWRGARFTEGKGENPDQGVKLDFVVKDNALTVKKGSGAPVGDATLVIAEDGKSIDATGTSGGYRNKTYLGILKIEGDTLTWAIAGTAGKEQKRPASYGADPGAAVYLMVMKRQKP